MSLPCMKAREAHFECRVTTKEVAAKQTEILMLLEEKIDEKNSNSVQKGILAVVVIWAFAAIVAAGKALTLK